MSSNDDSFNTVIYGRIFRNREKYPKLQENLGRLRSVFDSVVSCKRDDDATFLAKLGEFQGLVKGIGSNKTLDPDMFNRLRGDWSAFSPTFVTSADASRAKADGDKQALRVFESRLRESKISAMVDKLVDTATKVDFAPHEKVELINRLAGAIGVRSFRGGSAPQKEASAKKGTAQPQKKKVPATSGKSYSHEFRHVQEAVTLLQEHNTKFKKENGGATSKEGAAAFRVLQDIQNSLRAIDHKKIHGSANKVVKQAIEGDEELGEELLEKFLPSFKKHLPSPQAHNEPAESGNNNNDDDGAQEASASSGKA